MTCSICGCSIKGPLCHLHQRTITHLHSCLFILQDNGQPLLKANLTNDFLKLNGNNFFEIAEMMIFEGLKPDASIKPIISISSGQEQCVTYLLLSYKRPGNCFNFISTTSKNNHRLGLLSVWLSYSTTNES